MTHAWEDYLQRVEGRAYRLARVILRGLIEPEGEMTPYIQIALAEAMGNELRDIFEDEGETGLNRCAARGFAWAVRDETMPECAILFWAAMQPLKIDYSMPEYMAFTEKYKELVPLAAFSHQFTGLTAQ